MSFYKKIIAYILCFSMLIASVPANIVVYAADTSYSRINVQASEAAVFQLIKEQCTSLGQSIELVYNQTATAGDIVVNINGAETTYGEEGYGVTVTDGIVTVTAYTQAGAAYGLTDVIKQIQAGNGVSAVDPTQPFKAVRGLFVDCARKYFSVSWFENIIREMAWNGLNTLYISFSNDEGFRFLLDDMSLSFDDGNGNTVTYDHEFMAHMADNPEQVSDSTFLTERNANATDEGATRVVLNYDNNRYLTQSDMVRILTYAEMYGVNIIPEFNTPGHFGQVLWYFPEYRIQGTWYEDGQPHYGLDLTNTEATNFGQAFVKKYIDFFAANGCTDFCVGGDEYDKGNATNEQVAAYTNALVSYAESKGMTAYSWNDGQAAANNLLSESAIVNSWNGTSSYKSVNFNSQYLYYVLKGYEWKPNAQSLFETWTPLTYYNNVTATEEQTVGSALAIWCDVPNKETSSYVLESMIPNIQAFGYRMWNYPDTEYSSYSSFAATTTTAPAVSETTVLALAGYDVSNLEVELPDPVTAVEGYELVTFEAPSVSTNAGWYSGSENLIDGDTSTIAWTSSTQAVGHYMQVDLGSVQSIDSITVTSPSETNDVCNNSDVQISSDGSTWITVGTHAGNSSQSVSNTYSINDDIRYIRVTITEAKANWWQLSEISWSPKKDTSNSIADGTYIIVNDTNKAMNNTVSGSGLDKTQVTVSGNIAGGVDSSYEWTFTKQTNGTYYITNAAGDYLNISSSGVTTSSTAQEITAIVSGGKVQLSNGSYAINYYASNGQLFSWWYTGTDDANNMQTLYKKVVSSSALNTQELYDLILEARAYTSSGDVDDVYGDVEFEALEYELAKATEIYLSAYSDQDNYNEDLKQEELDAAVVALQTAIDKLILSNKTINYIEIPVEILDFRADGVMFEYAQNAAGKGLYELLTDTKFGGLTYGNVSVSMPGESGDRITNDPINGWNEDTKRTGLVEDYLVNGKPVYKEVTVDYVAKLIAKGYFDDLSSRVSGWNSNISSKITSLYSGYSSDTDTNSNLGDWSSTIAKTSTGENGGDLLWADINTCYDLAYYILNNMWRATDDTDGVDTYNMTVTDRNTFRLLYDKDTDWYLLDATKEMNYVGDYIYNTDLTTENTAETKFTPINDLGYESSSSFGDTTDTMEGVNSHFTVHASGSFVYNADDNLYFYFDGDDDVYYYINGILVMDIGGAHSHCDDELYLNSIAAEIGLEDGGIYTFDMFYAERHTTQNNLAFKSNIKVMDTMSTTSKGQYHAETGEAISYGSIVKEGDEIAYSFNLMNLRSVDITDITFVDDTLGTHISPDMITLYDSSLTNGSVTTLDDILVYYRSYDRPSPNETGTINSSTPVSKTVSEMVAMINEANSVSSDGTKTYSSIPTGSYVVDVQTEDELKTLLALGISIDTQISVYGFKRTVVDTDRPYENTVLSNAYYVSNGERHALNGVASQKLTVIDSFDYPTDVEKIVVDYGKTININVADITDNIELNDGVTATFYGITPSGAHNQTRLEATSILGTGLNTEYTTPGRTGAYTLIRKDGADEGTAEIIQMRPTDFWSGKEVIYAAYEIVDEALKDTEYKKYYLLIAIEIYPATNVYYETDFADGIFTTIQASDATDEYAWTVSEDTIDSGNDQIQDDGIVSYDVTDDEGNVTHPYVQTYGYDSSYDDDGKLSDGSSLFVKGKGAKNTKATFTFTGTGFDIISNTGIKQGMIKVQVYKTGTTERVKNISVLNKHDSNYGDLYQIPVISIEDLAYGTYDVEIGVQAEYVYDGDNETLLALARGDEFYFDAVRIYNPAGVEDAENGTTVESTALEVYKADGEAYPVITEVRDILIDQGDFDVDADTTGAIFIERYENNTHDVTIGEYDTYGPNNEVYLSEGQGVVFEINDVDLDNIASIDIGAKSVNGSEVQLQAIISKDTDKETNTTKEINYSISSCTPQYYELVDGTTNMFATAENTIDVGSAYVFITNNITTGNNSGSETGAAVLSITDIKIAYKDKPEYEVSYPITENSTAALLSFARNCVTPDYDIQDAEFKYSTCNLFGNATLVVETTTDVESIKVVNTFGKAVTSSVTYKDTDSGIRVWEMDILMKQVGVQTYTVTGYGFDGTSGSSAEAQIEVVLKEGGGWQDAKNIFKTLFNCRILSIRRSSGNKLY